MSFSNGITVADFQKELKSSKMPILIDFWATWCPPCRALKPVLERFEAKHGSKILVRKIDIEENPELATHYNVKSIPTLKIIVDGNEVATRLGAMSDDQLEEFVSSKVSL